MATVRNIGVTGGELEGFLELDTSSVYVPEGRFRALDTKSVKIIAESILKNGQLQPILVDKNGNLIDGNHRLNACIQLGISVVAQVIDEVNEDKLALIEIDTNLCRKELTQSELELHLAERKKIYLKLYPETAKATFKKSDTKSFTEDTADTLGVSKKTIERAVKRGEEATNEMREARDNKEITTSEVDEIIKETAGLSVEDKNQALKDKLKAKAEAKAIPKVTKDVPKEEGELLEPVKGQSEDINEVLKLNKILEDSFISLNKVVEANKLKISNLETLLEKEKESNKKLRERIAKAKEANAGIKI